MNLLSTTVLVLFILAAIVVLVLILNTAYTVRTASAGIVERFGKFNRIVQPGLHLRVPFAEHVYYVDLQVQQAQVQVETKTRDNVFVQIPVSVQYQVLPEKVYESFYLLSRAQKQMRAGSSIRS
jgi:regulator of protease activity HflC (stomatin/prohibitin superfamily)